MRAIPEAWATGPARLTCGNALGRGHEDQARLAATCLALPGVAVLDVGEKALGWAQATSLQTAYGQPPLHAAVGAPEAGIRDARAGSNQQWKKWAFPLGVAPECFDC